MELLFMICSKEVFKTYRISSEATASQTVEISAQTFLLKDSLELLILEMDADWFFADNPDRTYQIYEKGQPITHQPIQNQSVFQVKTVHKDYLCILAFTDIDVRKGMKHYSLQDQKTIPLGRQDNQIIQYDISGLISNLHARIDYVNQRWVLYDVGTNGIYINSKRVNGCQSLECGDIIDIFGLQIVFLEEEIAVIQYGGSLKIGLERISETVADVNVADAADEAGAEKVPQNLFHRAPRVVLPLRREAIELDVPPTMREPHKQPMLLSIGPALTMAIPMLLGFAVASYSMRSRGQQGGSYLYTGLITAVASAILGTVWASLNVRNNQKRYAEAEQQRQTAYTNYMEQQEQMILEQYEANANAMRSMYPSVREVCRYDAGTQVLWNRNSMHMDYLTHRIGLGETAFQAEIKMPKEKFEVYPDALKEMPRRLIRKYQTLYQVPICIDFEKHRLMGVIEEGGGSHILYTLITQFAVHHSYTDVKMVLFLDGRNNRVSEDRGFVRWLPHVWSEDKKIRFVDFGEGHSEELIYELSHIFRRRMEREQGEDEKVPKLPHYMILIENYKRIEDELPLYYLFSQQEKCGLTTILFADEYGELPNTCTYMLQKNKYFTGAYDIGEGEAKRKWIGLDTVVPNEVAALARRLSGIETKEPKRSAKLPETLTLFELFDIQEIEELCVEQKWAESRPDLYLKAAIGIKAGGGICYLDVHEKAHGPHGLIAGMTGSGKSEILQTYIISMAVRYRPEEVGFFLIDYKGGGMANLFLKLPHLVGHISNLSGAMIQRAMVSIKSENKRRQEIFNQSGVNHIHEYIRKYRAGKTMLPLPHIMIIIDEFAELKKEEPDFMKELISVAQVGRSLGVHLILATQKPSGTVDDNIRSNARFRLCLRVQDRQDSTDMLHKADAAYITQSGRAYFQVGNDELYELVQGAWSSAPYERNQNQYRDAAALITLSGREECFGRSKTVREDRKGCQEAHTRTQLEAVIDRICETDAKIDRQQVMKLWLPMLPTVLSIGEVQKLTKGGDTKSDTEDGDIIVAVGRYDHPKQQRQDTFYIKLTEGGHHVICGMVTSGKSTFLQTLVYALVTQYSPEQINLYMIDCSSHFLSPFQYTPHAGGFMGENDIEEMKRTMHMLHWILAERKELLQGGNFRQYIKSVKMLPAVVLIIDNYAIFREKTDGLFENDLMEFSRIGEAYGIYLIVTAAGFGAGELSNRMAENFRTAICLRMTDKYQYAGILRVMRVETCPEGTIYGRGLAWVDGELLEFQTALALPEIEDYERMSQIQRVCRELDREWGSRERARKIPSIPEPLTAEVLISQSIDSPAYLDQDVLPIGYFIETAEICTFHFEKWFCLTVSGRRNTGKTNLLKLLILEEVRRGSLVYIIDSSEHKLKEFQEREDLNIAGYYSEAEELYAFYEHIGETFKARNHQKSVLKKAGRSGSEIYLSMCEDQRCFIVISDLNTWTSECYVNPILNRAEPLIYNLLEKGSLHNIYFVGSSRQKGYAEVAGRRIYETFTGYRTGVHMGGMVGEDKLLDFSYVAYREQDRTIGQGRGMIPDMETASCNGKGQIVVPIV